MEQRIRKNAKGFTLVEVIVVSVIVAVLAGVAIPIYIGYVNDATVNTCNNLASDLATAVSAGINGGATVITGTWPGNNVGPLTISWTMPASFMNAGGAGANTAPLFRIPSGMTITVTGTGLVAGTALAPFTITAWKTAKPALTGAAANY